MAETLNQISGFPEKSGICMTEADIFLRKKDLRREKTALRRGLLPGYREHANALICEHLKTVLPPPESYGTLVGYLTDGTEPDILPVLHQALSLGKSLCLPRFCTPEHYELAVVQETDFVMGKYNIPEPAASCPEASEKQIENAVWLIPGVAFDKNFRRLGRGKGVYDRLLDNHVLKLAIGIFYQCQECVSVPVSPWDKLLDIVVTEEKVLHRTDSRQ